MTDSETLEVTARVEDNWAALEVDGETQTIRADTEEEVRHEVLRRAMQIAADANADVNLLATDRDGEWRLIVTPQGDISETGNHSHAHGAHQVAEATTDDDQQTIATSAAVDPIPRWSDGLDPQSEPEADPIDTSNDERPLIDDEGPSIDEEAPAIDSRPPQNDDLPSIWDTVKETKTPIPAPLVAERATKLEPPLDVSHQADEPETAPDADELPLMAEPPAPADGAPPSPADPPATPAAVLPTLADFQATQPPPVAGPATKGWRGAVRRGTGGLISPPPSAKEQRHREAVASVTRSLSGPRTICVINPKGGAHKTTATMLIAATFGLYRGGYTLAWDNNETRGTLGWRAHRSGHANTAVNLLNDIDRFADLRSARVGDLDSYVRSQAEAQFDVLASDEDAAASSMIDDEAFRRLHETLQRFYRIIVVDTGNNMRASNWEAAVTAADQLVIVSAIREDTAGGAAWMVEGLARKGHGAKLREAVTILSAPDKNVDAQLRTRLTDHFGSLTRDVVEVPYDGALVSGAGISVGSLAPATREAWLTATATIANGL